MIIRYLFMILAIIRINILLLQSIFVTINDIDVDIVYHHRCYYVIIIIIFIIVIIIRLLLLSLELSLFI